MRVAKNVLMVVACMSFVSKASAQVLNFTNRPVEDEALLQDRADTVHLPAGSAVWAVMNVAPLHFTSVNAFARTEQGDGALRVTIDMASPSGVWQPVSSRLVPVAPEDGTGTVTMLPIIPDKPDDSQPFRQLLDRIAAHKGGGPILVRVKVEGGLPQYFTQNGFYLDVAGGLGRYGTWLDRRSATRSAANADFEREHLRPRSEFVKSYRSRRSDPKFVSDVHRWWSGHGGTPLLSAKACSDDYIVMRNDLGIVTEKQLCALVTYSRGDKCFAMIRRFSYRRMGRDTFEGSVVDATYAGQHLPADAGESFSGARPYEIECSAAR